MKNKFILVIITIVIIAVIGVILFLVNDKPAKVYNLNEEITMDVKDKVKVGDLNISLLSITDNTCPDDVECVWSGEYLYEFLVNKEKITLGSVTKKEYTLDKYVFVLSDDSSSEFVKFMVNKVE